MLCYFSGCYADVIIILDILSQNVMEFVDVVKDEILTKLSIGYIADHLSLVVFNTSAEKMFALNDHFNKTISMIIFVTKFIILQQQI